MAQASRLWMIKVLHCLPMRVHRLEACATNGGGTEARPTNLSRFYGWTKDPGATGPDVLCTPNLLPFSPALPATP